MTNPVDLTPAIDRAVRPPTEADTPAASALRYRLAVVLAAAGTRPAEIRTMDDLDRAVRRASRRRP